MSRNMKVLMSLSIVIGALALAAPHAVRPARASVAQTYLVLYKGQAVPSDAGPRIAEAGGSMVYSYDPIGVAIAQSDTDSFKDRLLADGRIEGVSPTGGFGVQLNDAVELVDATEVIQAGPWGDPMSTRQWDMVQIHVPEAQGINAGDPSVVVGDIDTGLEFTHEDLAANVDFADSVSCIGGVPNPDPAAWMDDNGHGTHTAGTIAAARNGIGVVGVAPRVRIAGIKAANSRGLFLPEAVVCAFMWAGTHHIDVTNNSYFADPWLFNCRDDAEQRAIWKAEQRAIRFAMQHGVTVVAAQGNENTDLSKRSVDTISPDDGTPITREVTNACVVIPVEIPGVIGVTANGNLMQKSSFSSFGSGVVQVVAPGGDSRFQRTTDGARGLVLSTFRGNRYALAQGTSMASPHVAGVAALIISRYGKLSPGAVQAMITRTADPVACPANPFDPSGTGTFLATCEGGAGYNGFYGHGQVNALAAISQ
ncbi:MAG TPA: S8 family serine peptidase [Kofleriaceae bacterium]|nr:S8 family serine peptidase [Kofleriaceae bacterium]